MNSQHLIAQELRNMGFSTYIKDDSVIVGLRRFLSTNEVETALEQAFGEIQFNISRIDYRRVKVN